MKTIIFYMIGLMIILQNIAYSTQIDFDPANGDDFDDLTLSPNDTIVLQSNWDVDIVAQWGNNPMNRIENINDLTIMGNTGNEKIRYDSDGTLFTLWFQNCDNLKIENLVIVKHYTGPWLLDGSGGGGLRIQTCEEAVVRDCHFIVYGIGVPSAISTFNSDRLIVDNCSADIFHCDIHAHFIYLNQDSDNCIIRNCGNVNITARADAPPDNFVPGPPIDCRNGSDNNTFRNCEFTISGGTSSSFATGWFNGTSGEVLSQGNKIENCNFSGSVHTQVYNGQTDFTKAFYEELEVEDGIFNGDSCVLRTTNTYTPDPTENYVQLLGVTCKNNPSDFVTNFNQTNNKYEIVCINPQNLNDGEHDFEVKDLHGNLTQTISLFFTSSGFQKKSTEKEDLNIDNHCLLSSYPNPFNPTTRILFNLKHQSEAKLQIFDISGRLVETLIDQVEGPGRHTVQWDASGKPSGTYFYRLTTPELIETKKLILMK